MPVNKLSPLWAGALPVLGLAGCVSMHEAPVAGAAIATFSFRDGDAGYGKGNFFVWHSTQACAQAAGEGRIAAMDWINGSEKRASVTTGRRGYLLGHRQVLSDVTSTGGTTQATSHYCRRLVSFTPEAGHDYAVEMKPFPTCTMVVTDTATGASPGSLEQHDVTGRCADKGL